MIRKKKISLILAVGLIILTVALLSGKLITDIPYRRELPLIPDLQTLSTPLREQITAAFKKAKRNPVAGNLGMLGMVYHSNAYYDVAAKCYELAIKKKRTEWIWNYYLGYLGRELGESQAALENFNAVIEKKPGMEIPWFYAGEEYQNSGNNEQAENAFKRISDTQSTPTVRKGAARYDYFPLSTYAGFHLARLYIESGRVEEAEKILKVIIRKYRSYGPAYRLLGNVYRIKGDSVLFNRYTIRANDLPVYAPPVDTLVDKLVLLSRSELYLLKKIDEAEKSVYPEWAMKLVNNAILYIPENKYLISKAIKLYLMMGSGEQALPYLGKHLSNYQEDLNELKSVGDLLYAKGFYMQSMDFYTRVALLEPGNPEIQSCLALCLWNVGKRQQAFIKIDDMLNGTNDIEAMIIGVNLMLSFKEMERAKPYLAKLTELALSNPSVQKLRGMVAEEGGNLKEALSLYESALRGDPGDLTTIRYLGNLLMRLKMWDKSIRHFRKSLEYHPNEPYLLERLGTLLVSCPDPALRNASEGLEFSERAFIHTRSHSSTLISAGRSLALAYTSLGDNQNATLVMKMTINAARRENVSAENLAELEILLKRFQAVK